jgi:hypothetical protein
MNREVHVRFWESAEVRFHCATHLPPCLRFGSRRQDRARAVHQFLQCRAPSFITRQEDAGRVLLRDAAGDQTGSLSGEHELPTASVGRYVASADQPPPWTYMDAPSLQGLLSLLAEQEKIADIHPALRRTKRLGPDGMRWLAPLQRCELEARYPRQV